MSDYCGVCQEVKLMGFISNYHCIQGGAGDGMDNYWCFSHYCSLIEGCNYQVSLAVLIRTEQPGNEEHKYYFIKSLL